MNNLGGVYMIQIGDLRVKVGQSLSVSQRLTNHAVNAQNYAGFQSKRAIVAWQGPKAEGLYASERRLLAAITPFATVGGGKEFFIVEWSVAELVFRSVFPQAVAWTF